MCSGINDQVNADMWIAEVFLQNQIRRILSYLTEYCLPDCSAVQSLLPVVTAETGNSFA